MATNKKLWPEAKDQGLTSDFDRLINNFLDKEQKQRRKISPAVLLKNARSYFDYIAENNEHATITGFCLFCGFTSRREMFRYEQMGGIYEVVINIGRKLVEKSYEWRLKEEKASHQGISFALKNMGWEERQIVEHEGSGSELSKKLDKLSSTDLKKIKGILGDKL